ncbi:MAG: outer membrane protein assembly factor BamA [Desulfurivibrionaceae bacterium]|nr:outer membrane protein assembly factor BamA [Desulfurivibrionaceae bacterium]
MRKHILSILLLLLTAGVGLLSPPPAAGQATPAREGVQEEPLALSSRFVGNSRLADAELRAAAALELTDLAENGYRQYLVDDAAFQMKIAYQEAGFAFAAVDYAAERQEQEMVVTFTITEGPLVLIDEILFEGNSAFSAERLRAFFEGRGTSLLGLGQQPFVENDIGAAISALRNLYHRHGYLHVHIQEPPRLRFSEARDRVTIIVVIEEGRPFVISDVEYSGDLLAAAQEELDQAAQELLGEPYFRRRKLLLKSRVLEIYGNLGFADALVEVNALEQEGEVILLCRIHSGPQITISAITISGHIRTRQGFIMDRLALERGEPFSLSRKRQSFSNLYQTGLFSRVGIDLAGGGDEGSRILAVEVEEAPARELFFHVGWGSYEMLRGGMGFQDSNMFGTGRTLRLEGNGSTRSENIEATAIDPWLLGHDIIATVPLYFRRREEPSFTRREMGSSILLTKKISEALEVGLGYLYKQTTLLEISADPEVEEPDSDYTLASVKAQATWDSRNDLFFPTRGRKFYGALEVAEPALGSSISFWRLSAGMRHFIKITPKTTLGLRYDTGLILPGRNQITIPLGERFFNGGENSVRSFRESELGPQDLSGDPLGGMAYNVATIELRRQLGDRTAATLFVDYGNISPNRSHDELNQPPYSSRSQVISDTMDDYFRDFRPAVGTGLLYLLPIGPLRLDFAWNPDQNAERGEDELVIHFSIGMAF